MIVSNCLCQFFPSIYPDNVAFIQRRFRFSFIHPELRKSGPYMNSMKKEAEEATLKSKSILVEGKFSNDLANFCPGCNLEGCKRDGTEKEGSIEL